jgi:UDP-N-acetylmuramate--alanine ligase
VRGEVDGVRVIDDYAHHPTEIRVTLHAARERYNPRKLWCVFQPHQHSRTRFLLADFAQSFADADEVLVPDIYFVRDSERERELVSGQDLVQRLSENGRSARYVQDFGEIAARLARDVQPGDVVMTMGAGNIWRVADELVQRLGARLPQ